MSDEEAEKAADRLEAALDPDKRGGWTRLMDDDDGHSEIDDLRLVIAAVRSRDAEVAALRERVAELGAVIDAIDAIEPEPIDTWGTMQFTARQTNDIGNILAAAPSTVLAAVKRETAAQALEDARAHIESLSAWYVSGVGWVVRRDLIAEAFEDLRSGTEGSD